MRCDLRVLIVVAGLAIVLGSATLAAAQTADCDRLAASPLDTSRPAEVTGVDAAKLNAAAIQACEGALAEQPGNARIEFQLARALARTNASPERVWALYRDAADKGSLLATNNLAAQYSLGSGVSRDPVEATRLFRKAAEAGLPIAMGNLATRLLSGAGVEKNAAEALSWYRKGAEGGDMRSMERLARLYGSGTSDIGRDDGEARRWLTRASAAGSDFAKTIMAALAEMKTQSAAEIAALQKKLADSACYKGSIDGAASVVLEEARRACPDQRPQLRIETGMHVAIIRQIGVDSACHWAATASDDKTVRLWSLPDGKLLRTMRLPVGLRNDGRTSSAAVSPDGRFVAAGGADADFEASDRYAVTIFEAATGAVVARVGGYESAIAHLVFSPDGRWLAATLRSRGVRIVETAGWREIAADKAYGAASNGAVFAPDGSLYTVAYDGKLRRYGPGPRFAKEAEMAPRNGKRPSSVAIDPAGEGLAVGYSDSTAVDLYDAPSLHFRAAADTAQIGNGDLSRVAWSRDGQTLIAGGRYQTAGAVSVVLFDRDGRHPRKMPLAQSTTTDLVACGSGYAAAAAAPGFGLLAGDGRRLLWLEGVAPDMRGKIGKALALSADSGLLRFGLALGEREPVTFDLAQATLADSPSLAPNLVPAKIKGLPVAGWDNTTRPLFDGRPIPLYTDEIARSLAIRPKDDGFVLGAAFSLRAFDAGGTPLWQQAVPGEVWGVDLAADGRIVVAAYGDGTIRWHRWSDGKELLALFVNKTTKAWVAWTPSGYYSASPGGEDMIGWQVNHGWDQGVDFFPAARFRDTYSRPDIVGKVLETLDEPEAVSRANAARPEKAASVPPFEH